MPIPDRPFHSDECIEILPNLTQPERVEYMTRLLNSRLATTTNSVSRSQLIQSIGVLPDECQRDLAVTIRARGLQDEHLLLESLGDRRNQFFFDSYGIFVIPGPNTASPGFDGSVADSSDTRIIVSSPTWKQAREDVQQFNFGRSVAILPETVSIAGELTSDNLTNRNVVEDITMRNLEDMCQISTLNPDASFIIGSPYFIDGFDLPFNTAIHIRNGQIVAVVCKYNGIAAERRFFSFPDTREAYSFQNASVLICKDLLTLCHSLSAKPDVVARSHPKRFADIGTFIENDTEELLVLSCWGVGAESESLAAQNQRRIDRTYATTMSMTAGEVIARKPQLSRIIVSDRVPAFSNRSNPIPVSSKPHSMVAFRPYNPLC